MYKILIYIIFLSVPLVLSDTPKELYSFNSVEDQERFSNLLDTYRCPKCQSSNLAGSNAPIAKDLKIEIHRLIQEGKNDKQIETFLRSRYGDFITYKPAFRRNTLVLWVGPFLLLSVMFIWVINWNITSKRKTKDLEEENTVFAVERKKLRKLMKED
tara:strand:+ start:2102 stop:2572 length:471 start_codon:yes stop_codon:yes gene_type:complete